MKTGTLLKTKRIEAGLSQQQLADKLYIDRSMISRWESDKTEPNEQQLQDLCTILGVSQNYFSCDKEKTNPVSKDTNTKITNEQIYSYIVLLICSILSFFLNPWGLPIAVFSVFFAFKKRMPLLLKLFSILVLIYCMDELLFFFGIYTIPPKIKID